MTAPTPIPRTGDNTFAGNDLVQHGREGCGDHGAGNGPHRSSRASGLVTDHSQADPLIDPDAPQRFLVLDPAGNVTAHTGHLDGVAALLGGSIISYEVTGGLCFACSSASSATRHGDPNLHLSRMARFLCDVSEPFYGTVVIFGGVQIHTAHRYGIVPLHPDQEQVVMDSIRCTRAFFAAHPAETARAIRSANRIRSGQLADPAQRRA